MHAKLLIIVINIYYQGRIGSVARIAELGIWAGVTRYVSFTDGLQRNADTSLSPPDPLHNHGCVLCDVFLRLISAPHQVLQLCAKVQQKAHAPHRPGVSDTLRGHRLSNKLHGIFWIQQLSSAIQILARIHNSRGILHVFHHRADPYSSSISRNFPP